MKNNALVSVYIPTHNRSLLLTRAIDSVLAQTYSNIEIIVCSDGSTDDTDAVMTEYCQKFDNISFLKNEIAQGACVARNNCLAVAKGEFITGLDDDDVFHPDRVAQLLTHFNDKYAFICSNTVEADLCDKTLSEISFDNLGRGKKEQITLNELLFDNIAGNQIFTKTEYLKAIGGFDVNMPAWQDYDTWVRMVYKHGSGEKLRENLYIADIDRARNRITLSSNRYKGCCLFYQRYWSDMNRKQRVNAELRKAIFLNKKLPWFQLISSFSIREFKNWARVILIKAGHKF